jgi:Leucine-rich repeat (LRR) protein
VCLDCRNNDLTSLDISDNVELESLYCQYNELIALDVSNNTNLRFMDCSGNQLTTLDFSNNLLLEGAILQFMPLLHKVCVHELWDNYNPYIPRSPNVYFTTDCSQ